MEFFLDTADVDEIREIAAWGILDGVTTNPSLIKKSGRDFKEVVREIAGICSGPISAEVTAMDTAGMVEQGRALKAELPDNVIIKTPCTPEGLAATKILTEDGIRDSVASRGLGDVYKRQVHQGVDHAAGQQRLALLHADGSKQNASALRRTRR